MSNETNSLRQSLRRQRRRLGMGLQIVSARRLADIINDQAFYCSSHHIAFYLPNDGEISPLPLLRQSWAKKKHCYLPVIQGQQLQFVQFSPGTPLARNKFGILEPMSGRCCHLADLDLILVPLVAFDNEGNRLGMGGGYYDRTFASQLGQRGKKRPVLCGVSHKFQQVAGLTPQPWDFPLDFVATI